MIVSKIYIENKVNELHTWIMDNPDHVYTAQKKHTLAWYAGILQDMDDEGTEQVQLDNYKRPRDYAAI